MTPYDKQVTCSKCQALVMLVYSYKTGRGFTVNIAPDGSYTRAKDNWHSYTCTAAQAQPTPTPIPVTAGVSSADSLPTTDVLDDVIAANKDALVAKMQAMYTLDKPVYMPKAVNTQATTTPGPVQPIKHSPAVEQVKNYTPQLKTAWYQCVNDQCSRGSAEFTEVFTPGKQLNCRLCKRLCKFCRLVK